MSADMYEKLGLPSSCQEMTTDDIMLDIEDCISQLCEKYIDWDAVDATGYSECIVTDADDLYLIHQLQQELEDVKQFINH